MSCLSPIDDLIFAGSDSPFDAQDEIYEWFFGEIDDFIEGGFWDDCCFVTRLEVFVAMLHRLAAHYETNLISREKATEWEGKTLEYFDGESAEQGDADTEVVREWRANLVANFARLKDVLSPTE